MGETNALINALVSDIKAGYHPTGPTEQVQRPEEIKALALQICRKVATLLAHKASASGAEGCKCWLLTVAQRVVQEIDPILLPGESDGR